MTITDYLIDSALVLLVLLQIRESPLTTRALVRPFVFVGVAVSIYLHGIPTAGNDLVLVAAVSLLGASIGLASGVAVRMRPGAAGEVLARAGWASACFWVLGMGSRFAFAWWIAHGGIGPVGSFSAQHSITSGEAWTAALLGMAVLEVCGRSAVLSVRRARLAATLAPQPA